MNSKRIITLARRVMRQIAHDRRTVALVILAPMLMLTLGAILFRLEPARIPLGVVNEDEGVSLPGAGALAAGQRIVDALTASDAFTVTLLQGSEIETRLRAGTVEGVVVLPRDFSAALLRAPDRRAEIDLRLEGSNPTRSRQITARVTEAAMQTLASLAAGSAPGQATSLPITVATTYLYTNESMDAFDFIAPMYIAFLSFFFVFLLTCVAFLRERSQGTMERLLATPATQLEIILGYLGGLSLFALIQVAVIMGFTIWVLKIHYLGNLTLLLLMITLLALVGVGMGILASTFARNEFQVIQFIPIVIIPQGLLAGLIWPVADLPPLLRPLPYIMPLTYANNALGDIMLRGLGMAAIWPDLLILVLFALVFTLLAARAVRREVA